MSSEPVYVSLEFTPNPNTLKYSVSRPIMDRAAANFTNVEAAETGSPLAAKLFGVSGIAGVMLGRDFVTVTKAEGGDWDVVHKTASSIIESHLTQAEPVLAEGYETVKTSTGSEVEMKIREILDTDIRPAVAMDGGDIELDRYEDGTVYLQLQGSCAGCPSATMTLKMGIEKKLQDAIPEIRQVVSV